MGGYLVLTNAGDLCSIDILEEVGKTHRGLFCNATVKKTIPESDLDNGVGTKDCGVRTFPSHNVSFYAIGLCIM